MQSLNLATKTDNRPIVQPIVILAGSGFVVRNYLLGGCLTGLHQRGHRVVAFSPLADDTGFKRAMQERGVEVAPLKVPKRRGTWSRVHHWRDTLHSAWVKNETWNLKHTSEAKRFWGNRQLNFANRIRHKIMLGVRSAITGPRALSFIDRLEDRFALRTPEADEYRAWFQKLRPKLVFSPAPMLFEECLPIQVARDMGLPTVLSVLSWDNLSSKNRMPVPSSEVLVWSEHMRRELLSHYPEIRGEQVTVAGPPQFDFYYDPQFSESRELFFSRLGLDPGRPLIVYAGVTPGLMPEEERVVEGLIESIRAGQVPRNPQLHVRLHPKDDGRRHRALRDRFPEITFTVPGEKSGGKIREWQPDDADLRALVNTVRHGDVHINVASTMTVDAALMDRPVINVMYDLFPAGRLPSWGLSIYQYTHYRPIVQANGARPARTPAELIAHINAYLEDPSLDRDGRRRIVELVCGQVDGRAGDRIAQQLDRLCRASDSLYTRP